VELVKVSLAPLQQRSIFLCMRTRYSVLDLRIMLHKYMITGVQYNLLTLPD